VLTGERSASLDAVRDAVVLGAAGALVAHGAALDQGSGATPVGERIAAALPRATEAIDSGAAGVLLERWIAVSTRLARA
jgi:anthranilate phosphoribosyltransferase